MASRNAIWILALPFLIAVFNIALLVQQIQNPGDTSMPESLQVYGAQRVERGQNLYQDYHVAPFNYMPYTPFYFLIVGKMAGLSQLSLDGIFVLGRTVTFVCCLLLCVLLFLEQKRKPGFLISASGAAFFIGSALLWEWGCTTRPDILAILLSLAGIQLYSRSAFSRWVAVLFFLLAFLTKQSAISAPIAIGISEWLQGRRKDGAITAGLFVAAVAVILFLMDQLTHGMSTMDIIQNNAAPLAFLNAKLTAISFLQLAALPLIFAWLGMLEKERSVPGLYFLTSLVLAAFSSLKLGSNVNYYLEPMVAGCLLIPAGIRQLVQMTKGSFVLVILILVLQIPQLNATIYRFRNPNFRDEGTVRALVRSVDAPVLTDSPRLAVLSKQQFLIDPFSLSYLEKLGKWDSSELVSLLENRQIGMVVLSVPIERSLSWQGATRLPSRAIDAVKNNYDFQRLIDGYYVYVPKGS